MYYIKKEYLKTIQEATEFINAKARSKKDRELAERMQAVCDFYTERSEGALEYNAEKAREYRKSDAYDKEKNREQSKLRMRAYNARKRAQREAEKAKEGR